MSFDTLRLLVCAGTGLVHGIVAAFGMLMMRAKHPRMVPTPPPQIEELDLLAYRRCVTDLYAEVRRRGPSADTWAWWTAQRDELFATHPASPFVAGDLAFDGLDYHAYDPGLHLGEVPCLPAEPYELTVGHSGGGVTPARRFATVEVDLAGVTATLSVFWLDVYGGGVFLPLRDLSNGTTSYGGGRYLVDTVKSADLGSVDDRLVLDLNFAYHPSCVYDPRWSCPLAPIDERLPVDVHGGERLRAAG